MPCLSVFSGHGLVVSTRQRPQTEERRASTIYFSDDEKGAGLFPARKSFNKEEHG